MGTARHPADIHAATTTATPNESAAAALTSQNVDLVVGMLAQRACPAVATALRLRIPRIVNGWEAAVRQSVSSARQLPAHQIHNAMSAILGDIANIIEVPSREKTGELMQISPRHGLSRFDQHYGLDELLVEDAILRSLILENTEEELARPMTIVEHVMLNLAIDVAVRYATVAFLNCEQDQWGRELLARQPGEEVGTRLETARIHREAGERVTRAYERITDGLIILDGDWRYTYVNAQAEQMLRRPRSDLLGRSVWEAFPYTVGTEIERQLRRVADEHITCEFQRYNEPWRRWYENRATPVPEGGVAVYFRDITERKHAEEQRERAREAAEQANRIKDDFLATISHELRTPLSAVLLWAKMLVDGTVTNERDQGNALRAILSAAEAQRQLIEDLLDVSRIINGKMRLDVRDIDLAPVVRAAVNAVRPVAEAKGVRLDARGASADTAVVVRGDPGRLQQVAWNILSNALKFTPAGGNVDIWLERAAPIARIIVRDSGKGISQDFLPHVFDRFRQDDSGLAHTQGGLGIGLAVVRELVLLHGGSVYAESGGEGEGATFTVELALVQDFTVVDSKAGGGAPVAATDSIASTKPLAGLRVLLVEDDPGTREPMTWVLEAAGAQVTGVESVDAAMQNVRGAAAEVVVSDIALPGEDGYSLIRRLHQEAAGRGERPVPALALTAYARPEDRTLALTAGFQAYATKPIEPAELIRAVAGLAGRIA